MGGPVIQHCLRSHIKAGAVISAGGPDLFCIRKELPVLVSFQIVTICGTSGGIDVDPAVRIFVVSNAVGVGFC